MDLHSVSQSSVRGAFAMSVRSLCSWITALDPGPVEKLVSSGPLANLFSRILSGFDR
jgi:hypothetical protein